MGGHKLCADGRQVQVNRQRRGRAEDFCGASREQSIAGVVGRGDSIESNVATFRGAEIGVAVTDERGIRSVDREYLERAKQHVGRRLESEQRVAPDYRVDGFSAAVSVEPARNGLRRVGGYDRDRGAARLKSREYFNRAFERLRAIDSR